MPPRSRASLDRLGGPLALALALLLGSAALVAAPPATAAAPAAAPAGDIARSGVALTMLPVRVMVGGGVAVRQATVELVAPSGLVLARTTTNDRGAAVLPRSLVSEGSSIRTRGGRTSLGPVGGSLRRVGLARPSGPMRVAFVDLVSTAAAEVVERTGASAPRAAARVRAALGLPAWVSESQVAMVRSAFDARALERHAGDRDLAAVAAGIGARVASGRAVPQLAGSAIGGEGVLEGRSVATKLGLATMEGVVYALAEVGTESAFGSLFGDEDPTAAALAEISAQLTEINEELIAIQAGIQQVLANQAAAQYQGVAQTIAPAATTTSAQLDTYQFVLDFADPADADYDATLAQTATSIQQAFAGGLGTYYDNLLSTTGFEGLIESMYAMVAAAYPWWTSADIASMQATIDYYATLQAQTAGLLQESWLLDVPGYTGTKTSTYINSQVNGYYAPKNTAYYRSWPTDITANEVVAPSTKRAYSLTPFTTPMQTITTSTGPMPLYPYVNIRSNGVTDSRYGTPPATCAAKHDTNKITQPVFSVKVAASSYTGWFTGAVPAGLTIATPADLSTLSGLRSSNGATTTSVATLKGGAPNAKVLATSGSSQDLSVWALNPGDPYRSMWCGSASVSLIDTSAWGIDPVFDLTDVGWTASSGVLAWRSGVFGYVP